jgi:hypothetical protein
MRNLSRQDLACLRESRPRSKTYLADKILLSQILATDLGHPTEADRVLARAAETQKGRYSAEVHLRRAQMNYRQRKDYRAAHAAAKLAWQNRARFTGDDRIGKMLETRVIEAASAEQIYYASGEARMLRRAREMYERLSEDAEIAKRARLAQEVQDGLTRVREQASVREESF